MTTNNTNNNSLGLVDNLTSDPSIRVSQQALFNESRPPIETTGPALNVQPQPYIQGGTILEAHEYNITSSGIHQTYEYSHNTSEQAEQRIQHQQEEIYRNNRSIYSMPPTSSGAPNLREDVKPSKEKLAELQVREKVKTLSSRLRQLQTEESNTLTRLSRTREALKLIKEDLAELEG